MIKKLATILLIISILFLFIILKTKDKPTNLIPNPTPTTTDTSHIYETIPTQPSSQSFESIDQLFQDLHNYSKINFSSPINSSAQWVIGGNSIPSESHTNIPVLQISNNYIENDLIDKIHTFFLDNQFINDGYNDGDGTVEGSRGYISNNIFCILYLSSIPNGENPFSDFHKIKLSCGYTDEIKKSPTPTPYF